MATEPTELIVTQGEPNYEPIDGTQLLYASNTTGHVFKHLGDQRTYVLVTGRWFRADSPAGPWTFVPGKDLPPDFAKIPDESPKENVKASVPGTPQAAGGRDREQPARDGGHQAERREAPDAEVRRPARS